MLSFKLAGRSFLGEILALRQWLQQQQQWSVVAWALWGQGFGGAAGLTLLNTIGALVWYIVAYDLLYSQFHRLLHHRLLYKHVHKHHHQQHACENGLDDAINDHPFECVLLL